MTKQNFPYIEKLDDVLKAIEGRDEFVVGERDWGFVVNYQVAYEDTFGDPHTLTGTLRRECRGIKFDRDGYLKARALHKFFNLNERPETQIHKINFNNPFIILEKLDGSQVHPMIWNNEVVLCTKMGPTDVATPAQNFAERGIVRENGQKRRVWYMDFMYDMLRSRITPIFEWCSRSQRIVVDYPEDKLVLIAARYNNSGHYLDYGNMKAVAEPYGVPVVSHYDGTFEGINGFLEDVQNRENEEGYVVRFHDTWLKVKNFWYVQLHKTKELMSNEKDVWKLVLDDKVDDALGFMENEDQERLNRFQEDLIHAINEEADRLEWEVTAWLDNNGDSKKKFAVEFVNNDASGFTKKERPILFKIWDGHNARKAVLDAIYNGLGSATKLEEVRPLANNIRWEDY